MVKQIISPPIKLFNLAEIFSCKPRKNKILTWYGRRHDTFCVNRPLTSITITFIWCLYSVTGVSIGQGESDSCPVLSGVFQGSVLDPRLFLIYINHMPESIQSNIRLFADNTIMYLAISSHSDCRSLQKDLTKLETWQQEWLMAFKPDKSEVIRITKKKTPQ